MPELPDAIARINALTTNARNTWFALLGVLVFVGITLMGVEHIDFYGVDRATQLPLVNVEVPTRFFFVAAPILTAAIYGYFHLYLIRLWDALSAAEPRAEDSRPLGDVISPWLITDAALHLRAWLRNDEAPCTTPRTMEGPAMALNFLLAWVFGLVVMLFIWWQSMPARDGLMTALAGAALLACLFTGAASLAMLILRMRRPRPENHGNIFATVPAMTALLVCVPAVLLYGYQRTEGSTGRLAPLSLIGEDLVERPEGWLPHEIARKDFRAEWCGREGVKNCDDLSDADQSEFSTEWQARRAAALADMRRPDWHKPGRAKPDLRDANLSGAFLAGADLREARMEGADLREARMEGAVLFGARMEGADLRWARMEGADLRWARMEGADLRWARMGGADLRWARMEGAVLRSARMEGADLSEARMEGTDLSGALLTAAPDRPNPLVDTNLNAAVNDGGAFRFVDLTRVRFDTATDFRNAFADGSVTYTDAFARQMGGDLDRPCQWSSDPLPDAEFYGRWRGWIEHDSSPVQFWHFFAPEAWRDVKAIPPEGCAWKTGPMPGADTAPEP